MKVKKWLLALAAFAVMAVVCAVAAGAETFTYEDFEYSVLSDGTVYISNYNGSAEKVDIPKKIDGKSVTCIGAYAFEYCSNITSVTIPDSVTSISQFAFLNCKNLTEVTIPYSVTSIDDWAFSGCSSLASITILNSVTYIGDAAFYSCASLTSITIPNSVTEIGDSAFGGCESLTSVTIPDSVTSIGGNAFSDCTSLTGITIPESVTSIGGRAFENCTNLTSVTIPGSVAGIGDGAFNGCTSLIAINVATGNQNYISVNGVLYNKDKTTVICYPAGKKDKSYTIINGVTYIGEHAFEYCTSLTSITIPSGVMGIGDWAFLGCSNLTSITIPNGMTCIGYRAFEDCSSLTSITIPDSVVDIGYYAFRGCKSLTAINVATGNQDYVSVNGVLYNKDKTTIICYPAEKNDKNYTLIDSVMWIGASAFSGCANLKNIMISDGVTSISPYAFEGCISLTSITMPDSVMLIGDYAFIGCKSLASITICDGVTSIGRYAFENCTSLKSITIPDSVTEIGDDAFRGCISLTAINVATGNQDYVSVNGVLYNKNKTTIICYPAGKKDKNYTLIDSTTLILNSAFECCTSLVNITIPDSVTRIGGYAFKDCTSLMNITVPNNVTSIGDKAFGYYYDNNENKKLDNFKIYCYPGTAGEKYAKDNGFDYELLEIPTLAKVTDAKLGGRAADALRINWTKNASADGYIVEMYQGNKWVRVAKITSNNTTTFRKAGLKAGTAYKFRVRAYKMSGKTAVYSEYSATVTARTNPSVIKGAKLGGRAADALRVNWSKNASADGYIVEMYQGNKWVRVAKITNNSTTTFRKAGLKASTVYKFRVRAYKMSGKTALYGNYSATVTARTNPSIVKGVKIGGKAKDALRVNWTKNTSAQGYIVEMYKGGKWVRVAKITNNSTTTFRKAGLAKNTAYKFRVKAYYMSGKTALYGNYGSVSGKTAAK